MGMIVLPWLHILKQKFVFVSTVMEVLQVDKVKMTALAEQN